MKITFKFWGNEDKTVTVDFHHHTAEKVTDCMIDNLFSGRSYCTPQDQFCRATGRKIALARALRNINVNKDMRRQIWKEYFKAIGKNYTQKTVTP